VGREVTHAPSEARAAEAATLAAEGHEAIVVALVADDAQEPVRQDPAFEECLDLLEHEARQLGVGAAAHLGEERAPVRGVDGAQECYSPGSASVPARKGECSA
jgi:hypothetical protein